jgi:CubicO group peptidase (beta-lactamase class C family)
MTKKQTGPSVDESYGLGFFTDGVTYGHGGAYATNMIIDSKRGLVMIFLVQHAGFPKDGDQSQAAFLKAVDRQFGAPKE